MNSSDFKLLFAIQIAVTLLGAVLSWILWDFTAAGAAGLAATLMLANLVALQWCWNCFLVKKVFALPIGVIVIKYALLIVILYTFVVSRQIDVRGLSVGLGTIILSTVAFAIFKHVTQKE